MQRQFHDEVLGQRRRCRRSQTGRLRKRVPVRRPAAGVSSSSADSACLRCLWPEATRDGIVGNCAEAGVLGPVPGVLGSSAGPRNIEAATRHSRPRGRARTDRSVDARAAQAAHDASSRLQSRTAHAQRRKQRISKSPSQSLAQRSKRDLKSSTFANPKKSARLRSGAHRSTHIPLAIAARERLGLNREQRYLIVCARGSRSRAAAEHLREHGFNHAYSLKGGLGGMLAARAL